MKYIDRLKEHLAYETASGEHTFSMCACGRMGTRRGACAKCLREAIKKQKVGMSGATK